MRMKLDVYKVFKLLGFSWFNEDTIGDGAVNNHNPTDSHLIETISVKEF